MLNRALENCNFDERRKLYEEASRLIVEDAPTIFIFNFDFYAPVRKNVRGIRFCPVSRANEVRWLYLEE